MHPHSSPLTALPSADATEAVHSLLRSASLYLGARVTIARLEGRQALRTGTRMAVLGALVFLSLAVAYVGSMLALGWWLSQLWGAQSALPGLSAVVAGHLLLAAVCMAWIVHAWRNGHFFHATRKEFMEDKRWLETRQTSST